MTDRENKGSYRKRDSKDEALQKNMRRADNYREYVAEVHTELKSLRELLKKVISESEEYGTSAGAFIGHLTSKTSQMQVDLLEAQSDLKSTQAEMKFLEEKVKVTKKAHDFAINCMNETMKSLKDQNKVQAEQIVNLESL